MTKKILLIFSIIIVLSVLSACGIERSGADYAGETEISTEVAYTVQLMDELHAADEMMNPPGYVARVYSVFVNDIATFLEAASISDGGDWEVRRRAFRTASAEQFDPVIYARNMTLLKYAAELELTPGAASMLALFREILDEERDRHIQWGPMFPILDAPERRHEIEHRPAPDFDNFIDRDWGPTPPPGTPRLRLSGGFESLHDSIDFNFRMNCSVAEEIVVDSLLWQIFSENAQNTVRLMTGLPDDIRKPVIDSLTDRIVAMRDDGYNIYRLYIGILADPDIPQDAETFEVWKVINQNLMILR